MGQIRRQVVRQEVIHLHDSMRSICTTACDTESVSVRHRQTPSSFDRSLDISMMGVNRRDYCFFFGIYVFSLRKKNREKATYFDIIICRFFSLKSGDFAEDARLNLLVAVFRSFSSKKIPSRRMKKKNRKKNPEKLRNIRCFLFLLTYFHLAFLTIYVFS